MNSVILNKNNTEHDTYLLLLSFLLSLVPLQREENLLTDYFLVHFCRLQHGTEVFVCYSMLLARRLSALHYLSSTPRQEVPTLSTNELCSIFNLIIPNGSLVVVQEIFPEGY